MERAVQPGDEAGPSSAALDPTILSEISAALTRAHEACESVRTRLAAAHIPLEALAGYVPPRRRLLRTKPASMEEFGRVWRLGALLLGEDAQLYAAGQATRAAERGRPGYQSVSREERRDIAAAALRGGFAVGTPVNFDAPPIDWTAEHIAQLTAASPIGFAEGALRVRWRAGASLTGAPTLADYLQERAGLLIDPPFAGG